MGLNVIYGFLSRMKKNSVRARKIQRFNAGATPRILDLFAGCGGLSLGFQAAGYNLVGGLEIDPKAAESHGRNFFSSNPELCKLHSTPMDITTVVAADFLSHIEVEGEAGSAIDVLAGGPPCQAYSIVGRAKLREIKGDPHAYRNDDRADLYLDYLEYIDDLQPLAVFIENVPEILRYGPDNVAELISKQLDAMGYNSRYTILNSVHFGVPQLRDRMCLIAICKELDIEPEFPSPSHYYTLPKGYLRLRNDVNRKLTEGLFQSRYFIPPVENETEGAPAVSAEEAIGDLPPFTLHLEGKLKRGARRFTELCGYTKTKRLSAYASQMRSWPGFENDIGVYDHVIRYLPRDYAIFSRMQPGDEYPAAQRVACALFKEKLAAAASSGNPIHKDSPEYAALKKATVPPYDPSKFANKWRKIDAKEPVRTITAHIGKDSYSHIHYSDDQARTISVRETARLQSFPDGFVFAGTLDPALRQIGNSVPPLLAKALAKSILAQLTAGAALVRKQA